MKIILIKGVNKLGKKGEVKEVSRGFALNYLLPNNLAVHYTEKAKKKYQTDLTVEEQSEKWKKEKIDSTVNKIKNTVLTFSQKADEKGTFFAGVSKEDLVKALNKKGIQIKSKQIQMDQKIKKTGEYKVKINLGDRGQAECKVLAGRA